jgi:hypothetical protein
MPIMAAIIFTPDFIMLYGLRSIIYDQTVFYFLVIFAAEIILSKFLKTYGISIILLTVLTILLFYLKTLYIYTHFVREYFYYIPNMPVTLKLILTVLIIFVIFFIIQALSTKKFWYLVSYYITVSGILLMQMATLAYMKVKNIGITMISYLSSFHHVSILEYKSIISLFVHGYQTFLPLYKLSIPLAFPLSIGFMLSVIGSIFWLYFRDNKGMDNTFGSFSIVLGLLLGYIFFLSLRYFISIKFEFLYIAIGILIVFIAISYSNRKGKDISIKMNNEN